MAYTGLLGPSGTLAARKIKAPTAPFSWKVRNTTRWAFVFGWFANQLAKGLTLLTGIPTITSELRGKVIKADGRVIDYGTLGYRVVTNAGVAFLVDDWDDDSTDITDMDYHGMGTGSTAENAADTAIETEVETRNQGTATQPSANVLQSVGTVSATEARVIVEHGLLSASTSGTLWDRTLFSAINLANGDSIQFTYQCTLTAGS